MELPASLEKKLGPLPVWAWGAVVGGAFLAITLLKGGTSTSGITTAATAPAATSGGDTTGGSSGILGSGDTTAPITGGSGSGTPSDPPTSGGFTLTDPGTWLPSSQPSQPVAATPKATAPTNGAGAAGPSLALPQTVVKAQTATPYVGAASQPQMVASAAPAVKAVVAIPVGIAATGNTGSIGKLVQTQAKSPTDATGNVGSVGKLVQTQAKSPTNATGNVGSVGKLVQTQAKAPVVAAKPKTTVIAAPAASAPTPVPHAAKL